LRYAIHIFVGVAIFMLTYLAVFLLHIFGEWLDGQVPAYFVILARVVEYALATLDTALLLSFLGSTCLKFHREFWKPGA
jgi:hypothetical protein